MFSFAWNSAINLQMFFVAVASWKDYWFALGMADDKAITSEELRSLL